MARIEQYTQGITVRRDVPQLTNPNAVNEATATMRGVSKFADAAFEMVDAHNKANETTALNDLSIESQKQKMILVDKARKERMANPFGFADAIEQDFAKIDQEYEKQLPSDRARQAWRESVKQQNFSFYKSNFSWQQQRATQIYAERTEKAAKNISDMAYLAGKNGAAIDDVMKNVGATVVSVSTYQPNAEVLKEVNSRMSKGAVTSYISGLAAANPEQAMLALENEKIKSLLGAEEIDEIKLGISKAKRQSDFIKKIGQTGASADAYDIVNSDDMDYFEKRAAIDEMEFNGLIPKDTAVKARRVLTSSKEKDEASSSPVIEDVINKIYGLNAIQDTSPEDYLIGVQNIRNLVIEKQQSGEISKADARKLNNEIRSLTQAKMADATQRVGLQFYDALPAFEGLPPEYRSKATQELFYRTHGKNNLPEDAYKVYADDIVATINMQRRSAALKMIDQLSIPDEEFISKLGYTMDDVKKTAQDTGKTEQEVIQLLRARSNR